jgi:DNA-binding LacI/PurR family transcriptional regulator
VGVVLTERLPYAFADPGLVTILHGIATELSAAGNALLLVPASGGDSGSLLRHAIVDALVLCSLDRDDPAVAAALDRNVPLVTVGNPSLPRVPRVGPDNEAATAVLARHLLHLGHRQCAVITTVSGRHEAPERPIFAERVSGFRDAVQSAGGTVEVVCAADNGRGAGSAVARDLFGRSLAERPSAVFAVTDILALGVLDAAAEAGLRVPADVSVAGFDDIADAALAGLTTVEHDLFGQGRAAARLVLRRLAGERPRPPRISADLVVRTSTGPPPTG